jgi:hypothetical protein
MALTQCLRNPRFLGRLCLEDSGRPPLQNAIRACHVAIAEATSRTHRINQTIFDSIGVRYQANLTHSKSCELDSHGLSVNSNNISVASVLGEGGSPRLSCLSSEPPRRLCYKSCSGQASAWGEILRVLSFWRHFACKSLIIGIGNCEACAYSALKILGNLRLVSL